MNFQTSCFFSDVSEHDMDMLFAEEFTCSSEFLNIFLNEINISSANVVSVYLSKTDAALGESDLTVVIESSGHKIGLLIEDKIDAIAMPNQAERYSLRGKKGVQNGDYDLFFVFIIAPEKYLSQNQEAQKYPNKISYERIIQFFEQQKDIRAGFKVQELKQAVEKQKKGYQVEVDHVVTAFWRDYSAYKLIFYPGINLLYNGEEKGGNAIWPRYNTVQKGLYILHKTDFGFVDLTFDRCAEKIVEVEKIVSDVVRDYLKEGYTVQRTGKSAAVRLLVPPLDFHKSFEEQREQADTCFAAIQKMTELVKVFPASRVYGLIGKQKSEMEEISKFRELTDFIPQIKETFLGNWVVDTQGLTDLKIIKQAPYVNYATVVRRFISALYCFCENHPEYEHVNYLETLKAAGSDTWENELENADVSKMDAKAVIALLIGAVRADRFSEGALLDLLEEGCVLRWLERLKEIDRQP